jgi:anti-sigma factor RsiW
MTCDEARLLLNARLDGELDASRRAAVDEHVKTCLLCTDEARMLERVSLAIRDEISRNPAPEHLRNNIRFALRGADYLERRQPAANWKQWTIGAAAALLVAALASAPFLVNVRDHRQALAQELLSAHERALLGREVDVISTDRHTVKPWFNGKLPFSPPVADLADQGFPLEGGRVDYAGGRPVAALVYRRRLHRIDVFIWPAADTKPPARFESNGYHELSWQRNGFVFVCVSDLNAAELATFARLLQQQ